MEYLFLGDNYRRPQPSKVTKAIEITIYIAKTKKMTKGYEKRRLQE